MSINNLFPIDKWDFNTKSIFSGVGEQVELLLTAHRTQEVYKKGQLLFHEGGLPQGIFYISSGRIKKYKLTPEGREQIIYVANSGELIGYHAVLAEDRYPDSAATLEQSTIAFIPKEDFLEALEQSPLLVRRLLKTLSHEFAVMANSILNIAGKSVRERLALQLVVLREKYKVNFKPGTLVEINMGREDLASLVGTAREHVVRVLTDFKQEQLIETQGRKIIIKDVEKLIKLANCK